MTSEENSLITGLFDRLGSADTQSHDADAENLIRQSVASHPAAPYLLVQTVLVQEHALMNAQARIKALEQQVATAAAQPAPAAHSGGFLSGLFGGGSSTAAPASIPARTLPPAPAPSYPPTVSMPASAGGGFLRSALTTAAGVAGGAMLFEGIEDLLGHRSGAFGSGLGGGGGFMDTGFGGRPETVETVNNYYGSDAGGSPGNDAGTQNGGDFQDTGFTPPSDDFPASPDLGNDAPQDASADFGASNDSFSDSGGSDFSSDDSSQT
jgi:hypothetical protein